MLHYRKTCLGCCAGRLHRENIPTPLLPVHAFFRVFYTETLNCFELFAAIKLFGVINKSLYFVYTSVVLVYVAYICILYVDVF